MKDHIQDFQMSEVKVRSMGWKSLACGPRVGQSVWWSTMGKKTLILWEWEQSPSEAEQLLPSEKLF